MVETLQKIEHKAVANARSQVGRNVLATQLPKFELAHPPAAEGNPETPEQKALRVNQGVLYLAARNAEFPTPTSAKGESDNPLMITLGLDQLNVPNADFPMLGRQAGITHIVSLKGDVVTCLVNVPAEGGLGGQSGIEVALKRDAVVASQVNAEPEAINQFLITLPEGPQKKALQIYLDSLSGKSKLSGPEQQAVIVEAARASGLPLSEDILAGIANKLGEKPTTPQERWLVAKQSAEAAGKPFTDPEPPQLSAEDELKHQANLEKYNAQAAAIDTELNRAKSILGDQIIPDAITLVNLYRPEGASLELVSSDLAMAEEKLSQAEAAVDDWERIVSTGKVRARNPQTQEVVVDNLTGEPVLVDYQGSKSEAKEELKRAKLKRDFVKQEHELAKEAANGSVDSVLATCFSAYLNGEMDPEDAQRVTNSLNSGEIDGLIAYLDKLRHEKYLEADGTVKSKFKEDNESLETSIRRLSKLKGLGKGAAVGMAALIVMMVMQGMGGGGGNAG